MTLRARLARFIWNLIEADVTNRVDSRYHAFDVKTDSLIGQHLGLSLRVCNLAGDQKRVEEKVDVIAKQIEPKRNS